MQLPSLAVVIPTKNEERYLPVVLQALRRQTLQPQEIIVADAHSTDKTREVAASFGVKVVDGGMPAAGRNRGAEVATSELLLFLDADVDLKDDRWLEKAVTEFQTRNFGLATADVDLMNGRTTELAATGFYNWYVRLWGNTHPHPAGFCIFIKRALFEKVKGFDESVVFCEDHDLGLRAHKFEKFGVLDSVKISISDRRLRKEGPFLAGLKYALAEPYIFLLGPIRTHIFNYGFGYEETKEKS